MNSSLAVVGVRTGNTVVAQIRRDTDEYIWSVATTNFVPYADADFYSGAYDVPLTEQGTSTYFVGEFPEDILSSGIYNVTYQSLTGTSDPFTYDFEAASSINWNGSGESTDPTGINWVTREQVLTYIGADDEYSDAALNAKIDMLLPMAAVMCNSYLNRNIKQAPLTKVLRGYRNASLINLGEYPIQSCTSLTFDYYGTPNEVDGTEFFWNDYGTIRFRNSSQENCGFAYDAIKFTGVTGYATVPYDLQFANLEVVKQLTIMGDSEQTVSEKSVKDVKIKYKDYIWADMSNPIFGNVRVILDKYKIEGII